MLLFYLKFNVFFCFLIGSRLLFIITRKFFLTNFCLFFGKVFYICFIEIKLFLISLMLLAVFFLFSFFYNILGELFSFDKVLFFSEFS